MGTSRRNKRVVILESEEDFDEDDEDGDDNDMGFGKTLGNTKRVVIFESEEDEDEWEEQEKANQEEEETNPEDSKLLGEPEAPEDTNPLIDLTQLLNGSADDDDDNVVYLEDHIEELPIVLGGEEKMDDFRRRRRRPRPLSSSLTPHKRTTPKHWKAQRLPLTASLYQEFNTNVFGNKLPADLAITWNARLLRTAGLTHMRAMGRKRMARVDLASKVLTDEERLRSTLLHELCHVAAWLIDGVRKPPHGPGFKKWGRKCTQAYPGIAVTTCHSYEIQYKFTYLCEHHPACGWKVGRHSKSIDTEKMCCGRCRGAIVLQPQLEADGVTPKKVRKPSAYSIFNKQQHALLKNSDMTFKDKAKLISEKWARHKEEGSKHNKENSGGTQ